MSTIGLLLTALAVSMDAFWCGLALGGRQIKLRAPAALYIGLWPLILSYVAALAGHGAAHFIPTAWVAWLGAGLLLVAALLSLKEAWKQWRGQGDHLQCGRDANAGESTLVSLAVAVDASLAAFALGTAGLAPAAVALLMATAHGGLVLLGNRCGLRSLGRLTGWYVWAPGLILLTMSGLRLLA